MLRTHLVYVAKAYCSFFNCTSLVPRIYVYVIYMSFIQKKTIVFFLFGSENKYLYRCYCTVAIIKVLNKAVIVYECAATDASLLTRGESLPCLRS